MIIIQNKRWGVVISKCAYGMKVLGPICHQLNLSLVSSYPQSTSYPSVLAILQIRSLHRHEPTDNHKPAGWKKKGDLHIILLRVY